MRIYTLSKQFYQDYINCKEILSKKDRPYYCITVNINGILYAIPLRHNISHSYAFITQDKAGLDFTKAVVITSNTYIDSMAIIDSFEFNKIKRHQNDILYQFKSYLLKFKKALKNKHIPRNENFIKYSALQYFEKEILM